VSVVLTYSAPSMSYGAALGAITASSTSNSGEGLGGRPAPTLNMSETFDNYQYKIIDAAGNEIGENGDPSTGFNNFDTRGITDINTRAYTFTGLTNGETYCFKLRVNVTGGWSPESVYQYTVLVTVTISSTLSAIPTGNSRQVRLI